LLRFLRHNAIALLALFVALGGTTIAATKIARNSVTSASIKNAQVKKQDIRNRAVTPKKIRGSVPDADALDGVALGDLNRGRMAADNNCSLPTDFTTCVAVELTLPVSQRVLVLGAGEVNGSLSGTDNQYTECKLQVDNVDLGRSQTVGMGSSGVGGLLFPQFATALNGVTEPLTAGTHKAEFECRNNVGDKNAVFASQISAVAIGSG
jgi:hypothetical protein